MPRKLYELVATPGRLAVTASRGQGMPSVKIQGLEQALHSARSEHQHWTMNRKARSARGRITFDRQPPWINNPLLPQ